MNLLLHERLCNVKLIDSETFKSYFSKADALVASVHDIEESALRVVACNGIGANLLLKMAS